MKFPKKTFKLVSVRSIDKDGKSYVFVRLADTSTYENNDFLLSKDCNASELVVGNDYDAVLDVDGKFSTISLMPIKK